LETPLNQRPKILLVDDREDNILACKVALRDVNCELVAANSGAEALTFVIDDEFAAVFHDHAIFKKAYAAGAIDFFDQTIGFRSPLLEGKYFWPQSLRTAVSIVGQGTDVTYQVLTRRKSEQSDRDLRLALESAINAVDLGSAVRKLTF
jgi:CheY-like chemotaxis protein